MAHHGEQVARQHSGRARLAGTIFRLAKEGGIVLRAEQLEQRGQRGAAFAIAWPVEFMTQAFHRVLEFASGGLDGLAISGWLRQKREGRTGGGGAADFGRAEMQIPRAKYLTCGGSGAETEDVEGIVAVAVQSGSVVQWMPVSMSHLFSFNNHHKCVETVKVSTGDGR